MTTLSDVKSANPQWFDRGNKRYLGDVSYRILHGKKSKRPFLVQSTYAWTDMFGGPKRELFDKINNKRGKNENRDRR